MPLTLEKKVELLWDKLAITDLMHAFGRGLDLHDWALYQSTLCDELTVDFSRLTGNPPVQTTAADFAGFADAVLSPLTVHHQYSNANIKVNGDNATGKIYMVARHLNTDTGQWNTQYGWYENEFVRADGDYGWKISVLKHDFQWLAGVHDLIDMNSDAAQHALKNVFG